MADKPKRYESHDSIGTNLKNIVRDVGLLLSPRIVRERKTDINSAIDERYDRQTTDSNNKY